MNENKGSKMFVLVLAVALVLAGLVVVITLQQPTVSGKDTYDIKNFQPVVPNQINEVSHGSFSKNLNHMKGGGYGNR